jgi:hypothetical protein
MKTIFSQQWPSSSLKSAVGGRGRRAFWILFHILTSHLFYTSHLNSCQERDTNRVEGRGRKTPNWMVLDDLVETLAVLRGGFRLTPDSVPSWFTKSLPCTVVVSSLAQTVPFLYLACGISSALSKSFLSYPSLSYEA